MTAKNDGVLRACLMIVHQLAENEVRVFDLKSPVVEVTRGHTRGRVLLYPCTGCLEKKFTQEILNKIRSFSCTRLIFTRAHRKVGRSVW